MGQSSDTGYQVVTAPAGVNPPDPPSAPEIQRRVSFNGAQLAGLVFIAAVPVLAVTGLFGISRRTVTGTSEQVTVTVDYPVTQRFKVRQPFVIDVANTGTAPLASVEVRLDTAYVSAFSDVAFTPGPDVIDEGDLVFTLQALEPGTTRRIKAEMQAQIAWQHGGQLSWTSFAEDGTSVDSGAVEFTTMIWP